MAGLDLDVAFAEGESIHTENSHKYAAAEIRRISSGGRPFGPM
jgi:uncharacterized SAM-dependent methyltransferase